MFTRSKGRAAAHAGVAADLPDCAAVQPPRAEKNCKILLPVSKSLARKTLAQKSSAGKSHSNSNSSSPGASPSTNAYPSPYSSTDESLPTSASASSRSSSLSSSIFAPEIIFNAASANDIPDKPTAKRTTKPGPPTSPSIKEPDLASLDALSTLKRSFAALSDDEASEVEDEVHQDTDLEFHQLAAEIPPDTTMATRATGVETIAAYGAALAADGSRDTTPASFVSNTPTKRGRGGARGGRGRGRGRGGRGGRGGRQAGDDKPSNPPRKIKPLTEDEKAQIEILKKRQAELKKWCKQVGPQQYELLEALAIDDLATIRAKRNAHEKVPEHMQTIDVLQEHKEAAEQYARSRYEHELKQARFILESEREVIKQRFKVSSRIWLSLISSNFSPAALFRGQRRAYPWCPR